MKCCVLGAQAPVTTRPLALADRQAPSPGPGEVLVEVTACGVCRTDLHIVEGDLPLRCSPTIPGHQVVGRVAALGAAADGPSKGPTRTPSKLAAIAPPLLIGQRVGVAWLHRTCGRCRFCTTRRENLCDSADFTGWTVHGGYATMLTAPAAFVYPLPESMSGLAVAPLLCAGIIGFRALQLAGLGWWAGARLGIYGFGAAGHIALQLARARGADVYVCTRDRQRHQALAAELGARWVGGATEAPPDKLDAALIFAPAGEIVPAALAAVDNGGSVVLGGIHMSPIPALPYELLYHERVLRTVANNTRADGEAFLAEAARIGIKTHVEVFPLAEANEALIRLKTDAIRGAAVLQISA
jgi:propanol-preferring alcohol dehydrogenase